VIGPGSSRDGSGAPAREASWDIESLPNPSARGILHFMAHKLKSCKSSLISPSGYATDNGTTKVGSKQHTSSTERRLTVDGESSRYAAICEMVED